MKVSVPPVCGFSPVASDGTAPGEPEDARGHGVVTDQRDPAEPRFQLDDLTLDPETYEVTVGGTLTLASSANTDAACRRRVIVP